MDKGIIQIYYGEGQGKTSAALGNAIRKASNGQSAYVVQFMKGQLDTEYLTRLEPEVKQNIQNGLNFAKKALVTGQCDMLVLDEVLGLVKEGMATEDQILEVLQAKSLYTDVILTGRDSLPRVFDMADNILNIVPEKVRTVDIY